MSGVVASGGEKVVLGGAAAAVLFKSQYRWRGLVSLLQTVATHEGIQSRASRTRTAITESRGSAAIDR